MPFWRRLGPGPSSSFLDKLIFAWWVRRLTCACLGKQRAGSGSCRPAGVLPIYMTSIIGKKRGEATYYYLAESARVGGKPRIVSQEYLGTAQELAAAMRGGGLGLPGRVQHRHFGAVAACWGLLEDLGVAGIIHEVTGSRGLPRGGEAPCAGHSPPENTPAAPPLPAVTGRPRGGPGGGRAAAGQPPGGDMRVVFDAGKTPQEISPSLARTGLRYMGWVPAS